MGYELNAVMSNGTDTQEFEVAPGRTSLCYVLDKIAQAYPEAMENDPDSPYQIATLTAEQAVPLFTAWHADLTDLGDEDGDGVTSMHFGVDLGGGLQDVLLMHVGDMLKLAQQGYGARFVPV